MKKQDVNLTSLCRLCFEMALCFHLHAGDKVGHLRHSGTDLESSLEKSPILRECTMWETALCGKKEVFHMGSSKYMMMITTIISIMVFPQVGPKAHLHGSTSSYSLFNSGTKSPSNKLILKIVAPADSAKETEKSNWI